MTPVGLPGCQCASLVAIESRPILGSHPRATTSSLWLRMCCPGGSNSRAGRRSCYYGNAKFRRRLLKKPALETLRGRILLEVDMSSSEVQHFALESLPRVRKLRPTPQSVFEFGSQYSVLTRQQSRRACLFPKITPGPAFLLSREEDKHCDRLEMLSWAIFKECSPFSRNQKRHRKHSCCQKFVCDPEPYQHSQARTSDVGGQQVTTSNQGSRKDQRLESGNGSLGQQEEELGSRREQACESGPCSAGRAKVRPAHPDLNNGDDKYDAGTVEAVLVLAGGQLPGGRVPIWVERRLDLAAQIQRLHGPSCTIVLSGGGTPYKPPQLTPEGYVVHESASCVDYLRGKGVESSVMVKEWGSYDTIGNGYLSLTQHVIPLGWKRVAVVTSAFHMPRSKAVFEWIFGLKGAGMGLRQRMGSHHPTPWSPQRGSRGEGFLLEYHDASDAGIDTAIIGHRVNKEQRSLENLKPLIQRIGTLPEFHRWFHSEHKAYNIRDQDMFGREKLDDPAILSY